LEAAVNDGTSLCFVIQSYAWNCATRPSPTQSVGLEAKWLRRQAPPMQFELDTVRIECASAAGIDLASLRFDPRVSMGNAIEEAEGKKSM
jgi:hypothetical protein